MPTVQDFVDGIRQAYSISCREEDEAEPYKNKYEAVDLLRKLLGERAISADEPAPSAENSEDKSSSVAASSAQHNSDIGSPDAVCSSSAVLSTSRPSEAELGEAAVRIRCGLILLETDLLADGQSSIEAGLQPLEKDPEAYLAWLIESYNALGALYSDRGDLPVALEWLQRAEELYRRVTGTGTRHAHLVLPVAVSDRGPGGPADEQQQQQDGQQQREEKEGKEDAKVEVKGEGAGEAETSGAE
ncbi:hypothetical protein Vafri_16739, partial [Volvox africanus]